MARAAGGRAIIELGDYEAALSLNRFGKDEVWLVSGCEKVDRSDYKLINEASGDAGLSQIEPESMHIRATLYRPDMGAGFLVNSTLPLHPDAVKPVLEGAGGAYDYRTAIEQATIFEDIQAVFARVFPGFAS